MKQDVAGMLSMVLQKRWCLTFYQHQKVLLKVLPTSLKARIEKFGANLLEVRRVHVVADEDEFIEFNEDLNLEQTKSDDRKLLNKLLVENRWNENW